MERPKIQSNTQKEAEKIQNVNVRRLLIGCSRVCGSLVSQVAYMDNFFCFAKYKKVHKTVLDYVHIRLCILLKNGKTQDLEVQESTNSFDKGS